MNIKSHLTRSGRSPLKRLGAITGLISATVLASTQMVQAEEWREADLPAYSEAVEFVAIGSDGFLYEATSNQNGYVFRSIQAQYGYLPGSSPFTVRIVAAHVEYYLGASCDAAVHDQTGTWTRDSTSLNYLAEFPGSGNVTFRLLDTGLAPSHSC